MKTAKEKAIEIINDFAFVCRDNGNYPEVAKQCALICVNEIISELNNISIGESGTTDIDYGQSDWIEVKQEIEKL